MKKYIRKLTNNSSVVVLILLIFEFQNPGRSTFYHSIFRIPPENFQFRKFELFLIWKIIQFPK